MPCAMWYRCWAPHVMIPFSSSAGIIGNATHHFGNKSPYSNKRNTIDSLKNCVSLELPPNQVNSDTILATCGATIQATRISLSLVSHDQLGDLTFQLSAHQTPSNHHRQGISDIPQSQSSVNALYVLTSSLVALSGAASWRPLPGAIHDNIRI